MDKIRAIVGVLWRERFWVLTVVGILVAVTCWYLSATELDKQFASRKSAIKSSFSSMQNLSREPDHPNEDVIAGDKEQAKVQRDNSLELWQQLYQRQREEVLKWPAGSLDAEFIQAVESLKFRDPFPLRQAENMRSHYWNYIKKRFDGMLEIVQARKVEGRGGRSGGGRSGGTRFGGGGFGGEEEFGGPAPRLGADDDEAEEDDYLVEWVDQGSLQEKLEFANKPTALQIWVAQEDLWVYETLLKVIANTNAARGANRPDNTAVRVILTLEVGREAAMASREQVQILMPSGESGGGGRGGEFGGEFGGRGGEFGGEFGGGGGEFGGEFGGRGGGFEGEFGGEGGEISDDAVLAGRYLNAEGEPYPGEPEDPEFRRLPIHMQLMMDHRWLPHLLVECANATLPVEVEQVRINPEKSGGGMGGGGRRGGASGGRRFSATDEMKSDPSLATVDIRGLVYIYNKPDDSVLSLPGLEEPADENLQAVN